MAVLIGDFEEEAAETVNEQTPKRVCPACLEPSPEHWVNCAFFPADETLAFDYDGDTAVSLRN